MSFLTTDVHELNTVFRTFRAAKAPGPDGIQINAIKHAGLTVRAQLVHIINWILTTGYFPQRWKMGHMIFLPKPGKDLSKPESYRSITLLNRMSKIAEKIILKRVCNDIDKIIPEHQHRFKSGKGTQTQLFRTVNVITDAMGQGHHVAAITTDLSNAFDSINHGALIFKLQQANIPYNTTKIIENYLKDRHICGKNDHAQTLPRIQHFGVPQDSVLGPRLWNLYVSDLPTNHIAGETMSQYADDLCILNESAKVGTAVIRSRWAMEKNI
nr:unnamed protein product [Callosobruchus chinensis]